MRVCSFFASLLLMAAAFAPQISAQGVQVNSANPNAAAQGTINLDVAVGGSGFKKGANSKFVVTGTTDPGGVTVNSTTFVSSSQVTANITVSTTATLAAFDVQVTNTDGRSGKGTGLFSVLSPGAGGSHLNGVSVKVTVNPTQQFDPLAGTLTELTADAYGAYIDGQDDVCASINGSGYFLLNFGCRTTSRPRRFGFNLSNFLAPPTGGTDTCSVPSTISPTNPVAYTDALATAPATDMPTSPFQTMSIYDGTASTIYYAQMFVSAVFSDANQTTYLMGYHHTGTGEFPDSALTSYAQVRRMSNTEWVVESVTPSKLTGSPGNVALLKWQTSTHNKTTVTECGFYTAPFSFTLDAQ
jgi:hypothetical protein